MTVLVGAALFVVPRGAGITAGDAGARAERALGPYIGAARCLLLLLLPHIIQQKEYRHQP